MAQGEAAVHHAKAMMQSYTTLIIPLLGLTVACGDGSSSGSASSGSAAGGSGSAGSSGSGGTGGSGGEGTSGGASDCQEGCEATIEADCDLGPADQAECESTCMDLSMGPCSQEYAAFRDCSVGEEVSCDPTIGIPIVEVCSGQQAAFIDCVNMP